MRAAGISLASLLVAATPVAAQEARAHPTAESAFAAGLLELCPAFFKAGVEAAASGQPVTAEQRTELRSRMLRQAGFREGSNQSAERLSALLRQGGGTPADAIIREPGAAAVVTMLPERGGRLRCTVGVFGGSISPDAIVAKVRSDPRWRVVKDDDASFVAGLTIAPRMIASLQLLRRAPGGPVQLSAAGAVDLLTLTDPAQTPAAPRTP